MTTRQHPCSAHVAVLSCVTKATYLLSIWIWQPPLLGRHHFRHTSTLTCQWKMETRASRGLTDCLPPTQFYETIKRETCSIVSLRCVLLSLLSPQQVSWERASLKIRFKAFLSHCYFQLITSSPSPISTAPFPFIRLPKLRKVNRWNTTLTFDSQRPKSTFPLLFHSFPLPSSFINVCRWTLIVSSVCRWHAN